MNPIEIEGKIRALEVMMYEGRGASVRCAPARGSGAADTWAGKCEARVGATELCRMTVRARKAAIGKRHQ